jgi:hypothetical protein
MAVALRLGKSGRPVGYVSLLGFLFALCTLVMIVKAPTDAYQENKHAKWPTVLATIEQSTVRKTYHRGYEWQIETEVRYTVDGEELASSIHSRVASYGEERDMYRWVSQHPPGTPLSVRYDPEHHNTVIPDSGDMPESGSQVLGDLQMLLTFSVLSVALITIGHVLQGRREESGTLNRENTNE